MNRHLLRVLLALYPRPWRDRYGAELASLTQDLISAGEITLLPAVLNLAGGAALEWMRVLAGSRRAAAATALAAMMAAAGIFYLMNLARPPNRPASIRSGPEPAVAPRPAVMQGPPVWPAPYPSCTPSPVTAPATSVPEEEDYGRPAPRATVAMSPGNSCGSPPSPVPSPRPAPHKRNTGQRRPSPPRQVQKHQPPGEPPA
jgi:hypothetical protein